MTRKGYTAGRLAFITLLAATAAGCAGHDKLAFMAVYFGIMSIVAALEGVVVAIRETHHG